MDTHVLSDDDGISVVEPSESAPPPNRARAAWALVVIALIAGAVAVRFWLALGPLGRTADSDETIVGLMALHLLHHHELRAFYWGQAYGGSLEAILVSPFVAIFGATTLGLRFASVLLTLVTAWITWRIALHLFERRVAMWAGLLALWWPLTLVYFGTQERGFYPLTAALGLAAVLMAVNIDDDAPRTLPWLGLGLAVGLGWWVSPNTLYYAIPVALWLIVRGHYRQVRNIAVALGGFALGSSVWIVANVHSGMASTHSPNWAGTSTYWSRFRFFWGTGLPFALGLRRPWGGQWYWNPLVGRVLYASVLIAIVFGARKLFRTQWIDLLLLACSPFVFALFAPTWRLSEGRYTFFIASMLPLVLCRVVRYRVGAALVVVLVAATGIAFARDYKRLERPIAASVLPITRMLEQEGYHTAIANYWIAFRITYQSDERVIASPIPGLPSIRYPPYLSTIYNSTPAYVFNARGQYSKDDRLIRALDRVHIPYRRISANNYYAILPERRIITLP